MSSYTGQWNDHLLNVSSHLFPPHCLIYNPGLINAQYLKLPLKWGNYSSLQRIFCNCHYTTAENFISITTLWDEDRHNSREGTIQFGGGQTRWHTTDTGGLSKKKPDRIYFSGNSADQHWQTQELGCRQLPPKKAQQNGWATPNRLSCSQDKTIPNNPVTMQKFRTSLVLIPCYSSHFSLWTALLWHLLSKKFS